MNFRRFFVAVVFTAFSAVAAFCESISINLEKAVELAKQNNVSIKSSKANLDLLKIKDNFSWNSISPAASVKGSFSDDFETEAKNISVSGSLNMTFTTNLFSSIKNAKLQYENGQISHEAAVRAVELSVRKSFYGLLYAQENLKLQKQGLETSRITYQQNQEKFRNGKISELDVLSSRVKYESKKPALESAETTFQNDFAAFKQLLGIDQNVIADLEGNLDEVLKMKPVSLENLPKSEKPAPSVESANKALEISKNDLAAKRFSAYGPSVTAGYTYGKGKAYTEASGEWAEKTTNQLTLGVSIPLDGYLPWSNGALGIDSAKTAIENAELSLEDAKTSVAVKTESFIRKINQAVSQVESLKSTLNLAEQTYKMTQTAYDYGKTDLLALQTANDDVLSAGVNLKSQAYSLICAVLDLENILGLEFGTIGK